MIFAGFTGEVMTRWSAPGQYNLPNIETFQTNSCSQWGRAVEQQSQQPDVLPAGAQVPGTVWRHLPAGCGEPPLHPRGPQPPPRPGDGGETRRPQPGGAGGWCGTDWGRARSSVVPADLQDDDGPAWQSLRPPAHCQVLLAVVPTLNVKMFPTDIYNHNCSRLPLQVTGKTRPTQ